MTRWLALGIVVVVLSTGATLVVGNLPGSGPEIAVKAPQPEVENTGPKGKAVLDGDPKHEFGIMSQMASGERVWVIKNEGQGDLILTKGASSCKCTIANLAEGEAARIKPGESTEIKLTWDTKMTSGPFETTATVNVANDPDHESFTFVIAGEVHPAIITMPESPRVDLGTIGNDAPRTISLGLSSPDRPELQITGITVTNPELITVTQTPFNGEELKASRMKAGYKLEVTIKPGKELTTFVEEIHVKTDHPRQQSVVFTIQGQIVGPISVLPGRLRSPMVRGDEGADLSVSIWVRGQQQTDFTVEKQPAGVKVTIVPDDANLILADKGRRYKLTMSIPPGMAPGQINEPVVLKTNHPNADVVRVPVEVLVTSPR